MDIQTHTQLSALERYSFIWSEVRLLIAALALFLGGIPPVLYFFPSGGGLIRSILTLSWIISGLASGYLLYRWHKNNKMLFGARDQKDTVAFFVSAVSGLNLGIVGIFGRNIGMSISSNKVIFILVGIVYLAAAWHLYKKWNGYGKKMF